jgi:hypothetical protein
MEPQVQHQYLITAVAAVAALVVQQAHLQELLVATEVWEAHLLFQEHL